MGNLGSAKDAVDADSELADSCSSLRRFESLSTDDRKFSGIVDMLTIPNDGLTLPQRAAMYEAVKDTPGGQEIIVPGGRFQGYKITIRHMDENMHPIKDSGESSKGVMYEVHNPEGDLYNHVFISHEMAAQDRRQIESEKKSCDDIGR